MNEPSTTAKRMEGPYSGYYRSVIPAEDPLLTHSGPGTSMGEYMRAFWQPVCLSEELGVLPKAIRILSEDLVAFRDRSGRVGVLHRHCAHRGASLEFGIITEQGIRCCYHGWHYDVSGKLLETPCEPASSNLKNTVCQGAYPAFERNGLVFAYMGPPDKKPEFPEYDVYTEPSDTRLIPYSNIYPCNWLQVFENIMDQMHTAVLHNNMTVAGIDDAAAAMMTLPAFSEMPVMHWEATRDGNGVLFCAARRVGEEKVWVRISEMAFPNYIQIPAVVSGPGPRKWNSPPSMTRWHVPVDDTHMIIFGWRHFNDRTDPDRAGDESKCGVDKIDFLDGQTGNRTYEEGQRAPGDYEALSSQRPIAVHALEHPAGSDRGVQLCRRLLRNVLSGKTPPPPPVDKEKTGLYLHTHDAMVSVANDGTSSEEQLLMQANRQALAVMNEANRLPKTERQAFIDRQLASGVRTPA